MSEERESFIANTKRQATYLWTGLSLSMTLFFVQGQIVFVKGKPLPSSNLEYVISALGAVTFLIGFFFFKNYMALQKKRLAKMPFKERKQSILVAMVLQFVLFETLGLYGVLLSVLTQNTWKAVPFLLFSYFGFLSAFPKRSLIEPYFQHQRS